MKLRSVGPDEIQRFLSSRQSAGVLGADLEIDALLCQILVQANAFAPSEAGSILLEDPDTGNADPVDRRLVFVSCFGDRAGEILGRSIPAGEGIVGQVYRSGKAYLSREVQQDRFFAREFAARLGFTPESIICVPIRLEGSVCGVIELINRQGARRYGQEDLGLLEIFAGYISTSIRNLLDARLFLEMARKDDLSGLANDRWLHHRLSEEMETALREGNDLSVLFLDLDGLKSVNDRFGHTAGGQILAEMGPLLREVVGDPEATLCRYGGDEFVAVLPRRGPAAAMSAAERIRCAVAGHIFLKVPGPGVTAPPIAGGISASIGVQSVSRIEGERSARPLKERILREADAAMYAAKARGKNAVALFGQ